MDLLNTIESPGVAELGDTLQLTVFLLLLVMKTLMVIVLITKNPKVHL